MGVERQSEGCTRGMPGRSLVSGVELASECLDDLLATSARRNAAVRNIFLLYMPPGNVEAMTHYRDTIQRKVSFERIGRFVSREVADRLKYVFGDRPIAVWGSRDSPANRAKFEKMSEGDDLLIVEGDTIKFMGKVALKTANPDLSRELWRNINDLAQSTGWDLIYFIGNPLEIGVPFREFCRLFDYEETYQLRGFTTVGSDKLEAFYARFDDLYSILMRLRAGRSVVERPPLSVREPEPAIHSEVQAEDIEQVLQSPLVSDHVKMQWKLANLGLKAGEKVWVPSGDQRKLREIYSFNEFEAEFAAGIDLPKNYFENIDVVWKEEFRIDAAFEVENSTAIYSGLLRFADLNIVAPNTTYPMFIVAPAERRNRVREQLMRPVFRKLDLRAKVRFLPYETIDEIERFFSTAASGLSVALIEGKAEAIT
jgi:hypothetical protein